jgi:hypothetical protein
MTRSINLGPVLRSLGVGIPAPEVPTGFRATVVIRGLLPCGCSNLRLLAPGCTNLRKKNFSEPTLTNPNHAVARQALVFKVILASQLGPRPENDNLSKPILGSACGIKSCVFNILKIYQNLSKFIILGDWDLLGPSRR